MDRKEKIQLLQLLKLESNNFIFDKIPPIDANDSTYEMIYKVYYKNNKSSLVDSTDSKQKKAPKIIEFEHEYSKKDEVKPKKQAGPKKKKKAKNPLEPGTVKPAHLK